MKEIAYTINWTSDRLTAQLGTAEKRDEAEYVNGVSINIHLCPLVMGYADMIELNRIQSIQKNQKFDKLHQGAEHPHPESD